MPDELPALSPAIVKYDPSEARIAEVATELAPTINQLPALIAAGDVGPIKAALKNVVPMRTEIEKLRVGFKADALAYGRKVDAEAKRLTGLVLVIETPLQAAKEAIEAEAERAAREVVRLQEEAEVAVKAEVARLEREIETEKRRIEDERVAAERAKLAEEKAAFEQARAMAEQQQRAAQAEIDRVNREAAEQVAAERKRLVEEAQKQAAAQRAIDQERERLERIEFERAAKDRAEKEATYRVEAKRRDDEVLAARKLEEDKRVAAEVAKREAAEKRAEEESRPDAEKVWAFGELIEELAQVNFFPTTKSAAASAFITQTVKALSVLATNCKTYGKRAGKGTVAK